MERTYENLRTILVVEQLWPLEKGFLFLCLFFGIKYMFSFPISNTISAAKERFSRGLNPPSKKYTNYQFFFYTFPLQP